MGNYIVSARKYRPSDFDEVIGQEHITTTLRNAIEKDQLAQALLFCGPRGVGKTTCARIVARLINGFDKNIVFGPSAALNIFELDAASNNSVDDIRNLIDQIRFPPQYGKYKVYIIDEVHMLSAAAFNAFLKTLEEPPSYAIFILATTEKHKVLPTILSRCQIFDFNRISIKDIADHVYKIAIREKIEAEPEAIHLIAQKSEGALRDALSLFDLLVTYADGSRLTYKLTVDNLHILDYDYYFKITDSFVNEDLAGALIIFDEIVKNGFDGQNFIVGLAEHFRNLLVCKDKETIHLFEVTEGIKERYTHQAGQIDKSFLISAINIAHQCDLYFKSSKNQRLHVEIALMKITYLTSALNLSGSSLQENHVKKKPDHKSNEAGKSESIKKQEEPAGRPPGKPDLPLEKQTLNIPNISELKNKHSREIPVKPDTQKSDTEGNIPSNKFSMTQLKEAWNEFTEYLKKQSNEIEYKLMERDFTLEEDHKIILPIDNIIEEDILARFKQDLLKHLRTNLKNDQVNIETKLKKSESGKKLFTNTDKFQYLAKKYPTLNDLKSKLGLDPDF
ncbi:MAG TPA: DNA polymerase III subunit gamma/tau [Cyclobacteriaceae bacterium]|nr:DNA polymerase III subunit gamma/tau [Cyclobacteriaceae bacterium]